MGRTPTTDSLRLLFKESISISESLTVRRLPQEIVTEILLRLPVKSLLKFKCVSKPWLSLISNPHFIRHHFSKSLSEDEFFNHQLLFIIPNYAPDHAPPGMKQGSVSPGMKQCSLYSLLHEAEPSTHFFDIEYPSHNPEYPSRIVGIINGLVCLARGPTDLFVWNPVLRRSKHLPSWNDNPETHFTVKCCFGYDESNDDYKVVCLQKTFGSEGVPEAEVRVYSLRADSWRRIEDLKGFIPIYQSGIYANGKMYWSSFVLGDSGYFTSDMRIIMLDMVTEKHVELQQPDYVAGYFGLKLGVLGGRLFVLYDYYQTKADFWVMDKYGVEESWRKVLSIPYDDVYPRTPYPYLQVLCILSNSEIVFTNGFGFLVYNSKHKESRKIELDVGTSSFFNVATYVESLVWPYG